MAEANLLSDVWWQPATAVAFLRDGTAKLNRRLLPAARETQVLNAAIRAGAVAVIEIALDGTRRSLPIEDKASLELRFREQCFTGGGIGVITEVIDTHTGRCRRNVQKLLLSAAHVRALLPNTPVEPEYKSASETMIYAAIKKVYDDADKAGDKPPNINELAACVRPQLNTEGYDASTSRIKHIGEKREFASRRGKIGITRTRRK